MGTNRLSPLPGHFLPGQKNPRSSPGRSGGSVPAPASPAFPGGGAGDAPAGAIKHLPGSRRLQTQRGGSAGRAGTAGKGGKTREKPQSLQRRAAVMGSHPAVLLALALCALLEAGLGHPPAESHLAAAPRSKRCSCNSWLDKECIYFCHLDIIWVNTPGHTAPYGLGSPPRRRKRSAGRCQCWHSRDSTCATFCQGRPGYLQSLKLPVSSGASARSLQGSATRPPHHGLLRALRDLRVSGHRSRRDTQPPALPWERNIWKKKR